MSGALDSGWRFDDRFAAMMPMFHTAQLNAFCTPAVMVGATIYVMRGFDPAALLDLIEREQITQIFGLPMMYRAMLDHPALRRPRPVSACAARCTRWRRCPMTSSGRCLTGFGCDFALLFGQTEMSPCTTLFRPEHQLSHIGAVGTPLVGVQVAIMGPDGALLPPGEAGEIVYRGPSTMSGYLHDEEATDHGVRARLVPLRRRGLFRRRRRAVVHRPAQGRDQDRRRERRLDRGGEGDLRRRPAGRRNRSWSACRTSAGARRSPRSSCPSPARRSTPAG